MTAPTLALTLIVRDEAKTLPALLESVDGAFDEVILCDTGSKDKTIEVFEAWASGQNLKLGSKVVHFDWIDDFAAARNFADSHVSADWRVWADADDVIAGAANLRAVAAQAPPDLAGLVCGYNYAVDEHGNSCCYLKRERLVRAGAGRWEGRCHEAQLVTGRLEELEAGVVEWVHRKDMHDVTASNRRNMRILRAWLKDEPDNPRVLAYLGTEELSRGKPKRSLVHFRRYLKLKTGWDEERAQVHRKLAIALHQLERYDEAIATATEAMLLLPSWPDSYLTLAEAHHHRQEWAKAAEWARRALELGTPETLLIINPLDYVFQARLLLASSLGAMGDLDGAIDVAEEAIGIIPNHGALMESYHEWCSQRKREATAKTWIAAAQQLVAHDEQLKALALLEDTVPYFARDHHLVVAARSELRERLGKILEPDAYRDHYATGGDKPEAPVPDEMVDRVAGSLPRAHFLLGGVLEQAGVAA